MNPATNPISQPELVEYRDRLGSLIGTLAEVINKRLSSGDIAELRRLDPEDPSTPAFWRLLAAYVEPSWGLPSAEEPRVRAERKWAAILASLARLGSLHDPRRTLGKSLALAELSELRFSRLLRARDVALLYEMRSIVSILASKAVPTSCRDLADLLLSDDTDRAEFVRRRIARGYFNSTNTNPKDNHS